MVLGRISDGGRHGLRGRHIGLPEVWSLMTDDAPRTGPPDPVVRRVNDLTTTFLDTLGVLLAGASLCWWGWAYHPATGLILAAVTVTLLSGLAQRRNNPKPAKVPPGAHPHLKPLPGPEDPGNVHVKGR